MFFFCFFSGAARDRTSLTQLGITHVLNTAEGNRFGSVNTNQNYYAIRTTIKYMGLKLTDLPITNISAHFQETADFIEEALSSGGTYTYTPTHLPIAFNFLSRFFSIKSVMIQFFLLLPLLFNKKSILKVFN